MTKGDVKWIDAGPTADLGDGRPFHPGGAPMIAIARSGESYFASKIVCTHDGAQLTGGAIGERK